MNQALPLLLATKNESPSKVAGMECSQEQPITRPRSLKYQKRAESNMLLEPFINATRHITSRGNFSKMIMPLANFLPNTTLDYYVYLGSLTFPPCTTNILVLVFSNPVDIGAQQASTL
ncbi:hypothetical protein HPB48_012528 [Haemaphysalis longicornis]|uniref:Alpha-carbonic anhydrase domain-containing protein n=1 Tax=Haemaphysalis longicornis TaxID=44386 RepID=A0A9J6GLN6_HAELO|nr:hypothetical protein HPB48_012528 [Haemaphysalis longicornis]